MLKHPRLSVSLLGLALLCAVVPFVLDAISHGTVHSAPMYFFVSSVLVLASALLQFPFEAEEGWRCECDYDLSYLPPKSTHCPECGNEIKLEWSSSPTTPSKRMRMRGLITAILFLVSSGCVLFGLFIRWLQQISHV